METNGKKEIIEAVVIAACCTAATQLIIWGVDAIKSKVAPKKAEAKLGVKAEVNKCCGNGKCSNGNVK